MTVISNIDFHCHSNASDGVLSPSDLVDRAYSRGISYLAVTDHDLTGGVTEAVKRAERINALLLSGDPAAPVENFIRPGAVVAKTENGPAERTPAERTLTVIPGVEFSATWNDEQIHIVGLCIDTEHQAMKELEAKRKVSRTERAHAISEKLSRLGIERAYERCCETAGDGASITRGNYARLIFADGLAASVDDAFNKYLKRGQKAYVKTQWGSIDETVEAIVKAGGIAVLAHPRRYKISNGRLKRLTEYFISRGGKALEVSSSQQNRNDREYLTWLCEKYSLKASLGSDFHVEGLFRDLGQNLDLILPESVRPVWHDEVFAPYGMNENTVQRLVYLTYAGASQQ